MPAGEDRSRNAVVFAVVTTCTILLGEVVLGDGWSTTRLLGAIGSGCFVLVLLAALERIDGPLERQTATVAGGLVLTTLLLAALWLAI